MKKVDFHFNDDNGNETNLSLFCLDETKWSHILKVYCEKEDTHCEQEDIDNFVFYDAEKCRTLCLDDRIRDIDPSGIQIIDAYDLIIEGDLGIRLNADPIFELSKGKYAANIHGTITFRKSNRSIGFILSCLDYNQVNAFIQKSRLTSDASFLSNDSRIEFVLTNKLFTVNIKDQTLNLIDSSSYPFKFRDWIDIFLSDLEDINEVIKHGVGK